MYFDILYVNHDTRGVENCAVYRDVLHRLWQCWKRRMCWKTWLKRWHRSRPGCAATTAGYGSIVSAQNCCKCGISVRNVARYVSWLANV